MTGQRVLQHATGMLQHPPVYVRAIASQTFVRRSKTP